MLGSEAPTVGASAGYSSAYWFRGTPANVNGVFQGDLGVSVPTADGGSVGLSTWVNMDATNDTGDAFSSDGNAVQLTEVDYVLDYSRSFGNVDATLGVINYSFPNGVGNSTHEAFLSLGTGFLGFNQGLSVYYDFDMLDAFYLALEAGKGFAITDNLSLDLSVLLGLMGKEQARFYYGEAKTAISDLAASASLTYAVDEVTSIFLSVSGTGALDADLKDSLDDSGVDQSGLWGAIGIAWGF